MSSTDRLRSLSRAFPEALLILSLLAGPVSAGALKGVVTQSDGRPAGAGWRVVVQGVDRIGGGAVLTDEVGRFDLPELADGRVTVSVYAPPDGDELSDPRAGRLVQLVSDRTTDIELRLSPASTAAPTFNFTYYRPEYFSDKSTYASATRVLLPDEGTVSDIDMELAVGGSGTISGQVTAENGGAPIQGLIVAAQSTESGLFSFDRTDENGFYRITGLPAGGMMVNAGVLFGSVWSDVVGEYYDNKTTYDSLAIVTVIEGTDTPNINFTLAPAGSISGRVTAESGGQGLAGVTVRMTHAELPFEANVLTDDNGNYRAGGLKPGPWIVVAADTGNYASEYWNNHLRLSDADPVAVSAGQNTSDIDFALAEAGRISGRVTNERTGRGLPNTTARVTRLGGGFLRFAGTDETGHYEANGLPAGQYQVRVIALGQWWDDQSSAEMADTIDVSAGETVPNIDFSGTPVIQGCPTLEGAGTIRGTVLGPSLTPLALQGVTLHAELSGQLTYLGTAITDAAGFYEFACLQPNTYYVQIPASYYIWKSEWYDDTDGGHATPVTVLANQVRDGIDFVLALGGTISGRLTGPGGIPLPGVELAIVTPGGLSASAYTGEDGRWECRGGPDGGLVAGAYVVYAPGVTTADPALVPVVLSRFVGTPAPEGGVRLEWTTSREAFHAGFHVERADGPDSQPIRITHELLTGGPDYTFLDTDAPASQYWYWLVAVDRQGGTDRFGPLAVSIGTPATSRLLGPAINPSKGSASIQWELAREGTVRLDIFDASGRRVTTLVDGLRPAGPGSARWDGAASDGSQAAAGIYFLRFETPDGSHSGRLMLTP